MEESPAPDFHLSDEICPACLCDRSEVMFRVTDWLYGTTTEEFAVVECQSCRMLRLSPRPEPAELSKYYPEEYWHVPEQDIAAQFAEVYRRLVLWDHVRFVQTAIERSGAEGPVLDVGCGGGLFLKMMRERGYRGVGLDFSLSAAGVAWEVNNVPTVCASLAHAPFADGSVAAITMFHVLEHLYDPSAYLQAASELLEPNGRLIIQTPNASSWQFLLLGERWRGIEAPRHLWHFKARDLEILLDRCGYEVVRTRHFSLRDNPACLATSLAPGLDPTVRKVRRTVETPGRKFLKDLIYFGLVIGCLPFTYIEALCRAGCTVMMEARKKS